MTDPLWTFPEIESALGLRTEAPGEAQGVSIDSRSLQPGDLFVAIKGDRTDGHDYVVQAFEAGASAAVAAEDWAPDPPVTGKVFRVQDTLQALTELARTARKRSNARVTAITGSVGKTGTKDMLRTMLSPSGATHSSVKSYNNHWGVPLSLARMPRQSAFGVFEIGMNHAGEITPLTKLVRPHIAIVTWVAAVHLEFFDSVAGIADAKAEIFQGLERGGIAILPRDNEHYQRLADHAQVLGAEIVTFGQSQDAMARLTVWEPNGEGSHVEADILGSRAVFDLNAPGRHLASNAIAALAATNLAGGDLKTAVAALPGYQIADGRGRRSRHETLHGAILLVDETYNANPASMRAALDVLGSVPRSSHGRRIAVLGDMLELGYGAREFHRDLAHHIDSNGIDLVFCAGPLMESLYEVLQPETRAALTRSAEELCPIVLNAVRGGDAVMIKGSLGSRMGLIVDALRSKLTGSAGMLDPASPLPGR